jgi:hypothetical protein
MEDGIHQAVTVDAGFVNHPFILVWKRVDMAE